MSALALAAQRMGEEAAQLVDDGDRAWYTLPAPSAPFGLGKNNAVQITFNVPADADFYAMCLNLYYQYRVVNPTDAAQNDRTFRPCAWACWANTVPGSDYPVPANAGHEGAGSVSIQDDTTGPYQNVPFDVASVYSAPYGIPGGQEGPPMTLYPGALRFHRPYFIGRGKAISLVYTPLFTSAVNLTEAFAPTVVPPYTTEYRVFGVLDGYKKVTAFK